MHQRRNLLISHFLIALILLTFSSSSGWTKPARVVASILPVHALASALMEGMGEPWLLIGGTASPHTLSLKPSDAEALDGAELVFWIDETLESALERPLANLAEGAKVVTFLDLPGLNKLEFRESAIFAVQEEAHDDHDEDEKHDDHEEEEKHEEDSHDHGHGAFDPHIWLDPENAKVMAEAMASELAKTYPAEAQRFADNLAKLELEIDTLDQSLKASLAPLHDRPFVVFHDGYHYFERRYDLHALGAVRLNAENQPGARHIQALQATMQESGALCLFTEPQFSPEQAARLAEATGLKVAELDLLGTHQKPGPSLYTGLMEALAKGFTDCLSP